MTPQQPLLAGLRVIELATFVFGPGSTAVMADFGADVIKVEAPGLGDPFRHAHNSPPFMPLDFAYMWQQDNRNKRSIALDLKDPDGREALRALVRGADVLVTNFPPRVLAKLQITYEDLQAENPRLIYGQITGYGEQGPDADKPGFDGNAYWARTGLMDVVRTAEADPTLPAAAMGDHPSAMTMFAGVMTALYRRERTGLGTKVSTSLMANGLWAASAMLAGVLAGTAPFQRSSRVAPRNALLNQYRTRDDRWLSIIVLQEDKNWPAFVTAIERPDLLEDPRFAEKTARHANAKALAAILDEVFRTHTYAEWSPRLLAQGVTFSLVATMEEVVDDPQALLNDMLVEVEGHTHGRRRAVNSPFWLRDAPKVPARLGPELGAQGAEILAEAGYDEQRIEQLLARGVLAR
ncbi:MAG: CaiB/BaiF CoA transferase family protein [Pseudomonadota bacterium]|jgi:crotonobetainyl-CoA:carnitine CoA-transferase CaiB-like acyl-CoA transferase